MEGGFERAKIQEVTNLIITVQCNIKVICSF
jgi:hypothetical protein